MTAVFGRRSGGPGLIGTARPGPPAYQGPPIRVREWAVVVGILGLTIGIPLTYAVAVGSFRIPHNDDWAFSLVALDFHRTGHLHLLGAGQMTLIGHVLWAQPFLSVLGPGLPALHAANAVAGALGVVASFLIFRRVTGQRAALVGTACVALFPAYGLLSLGFMTDTTAFAFEAMCIALALAALDRRGPLRSILLIGACSAGIAAFSSRQTAVAAIVAVAAASVWQSVVVRRELRSTILDAATFLSTAIGVVVLALWRAGLANQDPHQGGVPSIDDLIASLAGIATMAMILAPALWLAFGSGVARGCSWPKRVAAVGLALPWFVLGLRGTEPLLGNMLTQRGANDGVLTGIKPDLYPGPVWALLQGLALLGVVALIVVLLHSISLPSARRQERGRAFGDGPGFLLASFAILATAAAIAPALQAGHVFDRYMHPAALGVLALLLWRVAAAEIGRAALAGALALLTLSVGITAVLDFESIRFDRARWAVGEEFVRQGIPATRVDAGYEWTGYHATLPVPPDRLPSVASAPSWWSQLYASELPCVVVMSAPLTDSRYTLEDSRTYLPVGKNHRLLVYRLLEPCPGSSPSFSPSAKVRPYRSVRNPLGRAPHSSGVA